MDSIKDFKLKEFYRQKRELVEEYIDYLAYLKPLETTQEVFYMKLRQVQQIRDLMQEGTLDSLKDIIKLVQDIPEQEVFEMRISKFFGLVSGVKAQIETIANAEQTSLSGKAFNPKWEQVDGAQKLQKFGIYNILDTLAKGDILKYEQILDLVYADVFTKLYRDTVLSDLEYEMSKIKSINI